MDYYNNYYYEDYLMHYGVKGMKWGVRRYQNKDGILTNAGKKRYDSDGLKDSAKKQSVSKSSSKKRLSDAELKKAVSRINQGYYERDKNYNKIEDEMHRKSWELDQKHFKERRDGKTSDEDYERYRQENAELKKKYDDKLADIRTRIDAENNEMRKSIFLTDEIKPSMQKASKLKKDISTLKDETLNKAYKEALNKFKKEHDNESDRGKDDIEYEFDHYVWDKSAEKKQALKEYNKLASQKEKEYTDLVSDIGKRAVGSLSDAKIEDYWRDQTYGEWGREQVDQILRRNLLFID